MKSKGKNSDLKILFSSQFFDNKPYNFVPGDYKENYSHKTVADSRKGKGKTVAQNAASAFKKWQKGISYKVGRKAGNKGEDYKF